MRFHLPALISVLAECIQWNVNAMVFVVTYVRHATVASSASITDTFTDYYCWTRLSTVADQAFEAADNVAQVWNSLPQDFTW